jgi:tetratricopeptide (TPR) repeat protein
MRRRLLFTSLGIAALSAAWGAAHGVEAWRINTALHEAKSQIAAGSPSAARLVLARAAAHWPRQGEIQFLLGACEQSLGQLQAAEQAWSRVPRESPYAGHAAMLRVRLLLKRDRLAAAEDLLPTALRAPGAHGIEALETLVALLRLQGRFEEIRPLIHNAWNTYPDQLGLLKQLAHLESINPVPIERIRPGLEKAAQNSPDDDRIWLGRANLAIRTGEFAEANRWLDACLERRPSDPAVWKSRLNLARAIGDIAQVRRSLEHLPPDHIPPKEALSLSTWFAARLGNAERERKALTRLLEEAPGHFQAVERLAELELQAGYLERAAELRKRKAELDRAKVRYEMLVMSQGPLDTGHVTEAARLAEVLGRRFEARGLWSMALKRAGHNAEARQALARLDNAVPKANRPTIAHLLAELGPEPAPPSPGEPSLSARPSFIDDAEAVGLRFRFDNGASPSRQMPETMSGGVGLLDYDGDGWLDVYLVQGGPFPPDPKASGSGDRLFRNLGDGRFEDASENSGISKLARGYGHGVAVGDYDNDGHPDLFITRWRAYALYRNQGDGTFVDRTEAAGLGGPRDWPTSAAFADLDNDGDLDLYVCHYLKWDSEDPRLCFEEEKKVYRYCAPQRFPHEPDHIFRNDGGRFTDVTSEAGIRDWHGQGLGVVAADLDDDGKLDLFVANDQSANYLFRNLGEMRFEEIAETTGVAGNAKGGYQAGMGVACGDLDGDGRLDLAVTNFYNESMTFYHNLGGGIFVDHTTAIGLLVPTRYQLGFGTVFFDADNDGLLDLAAANGHIDDYRPEIPYPMPAQLFLGRGGGRLADVSDIAGPPWQVPRVARGLASGDLDNDGRVDLLLLAQNEPLAYFHNRTDPGHALTLQLQGTTSNRDAVGARVTVTVAGRSRVAQRIGGGSYQSASDPRLHFGLGSDDRADEIQVNWPSGRSERFGSAHGSTGYLLVEGHGKPIPLAGFATRPTAMDHP